EAPVVAETVGAAPFQAVGLDARPVHQPWRRPGVEIDQVAVAGAEQGEPAWPGRIVVGGDVRLAVLRPLLAKRRIANQRMAERVEARWPRTARVRRAPVPAAGQAPLQRQHRLAGVDLAGVAVAAPLQAQAALRGPAGVAPAQFGEGGAGIALHGERHRRPEDSVVDAAVVAATLALVEDAHGKFAA